MEDRSDYIRRLQTLQQQAGSAETKAELQDEINASSYPSFLDEPGEFDKLIEQ